MTDPPPPHPAQARYPAQAPSPAETEVVIARVGEIEVTSTAVRTPAGEFPLRGTSWDLTTHWLPEQKIPAWAVVLALLGFFVVGPFSLLFLRVRRTRQRGVVTVTVTGRARRYATRIPVADQAYARQLANRVNYVRSLAEP